MKPIVVASIVLLVAVLGACSPQSLGEVGEVVSVIGEVQTIDISPMAADGPAKLEMRTEAGRLVTVYVQSCFGGCAHVAVDKLWQIEPGQTWQVSGEVQQDGSLAVYTDEAHAIEQAADG